MSNSKLEATFHPRHDPRWEKMSAVKKPYEHFHDQADEEENCFACNYISLQLDVWFKGHHYFATQLIDGVDFREMNSDFEIDKFIWAEMIRRVDDQMKYVRW